MNPMTGAMNELAGMDELARLSSPMHRLHPLPKLLTVLLYIGIVLSFPNTRLSGLIAMVIFPAVGYAAAGIPVDMESDPEPCPHFNYRKADCF